MLVVMKGYNGFENILVNVPIVLSKTDGKLSASFGELKGFKISQRLYDELKHFLMLPNINIFSVYVANPESNRREITAIDFI